MKPARRYEHCILTVTLPISEIFLSIFKLTIPFPNQGYHVRPRDGLYFVRLFADAQFYSLPRLISQLFESEIFIQIGGRNFQIPRDVFSSPGDSPNFFSLTFEAFFATPGEVLPGLDRQGLLRPPAIMPPMVLNGRLKCLLNSCICLRVIPFIYGTRNIVQNCYLQPAPAEYRNRDSTARYPADGGPTRQRWLLSIRNCLPWWGLGSLFAPVGSEAGNKPCPTNLGEFSDRSNGTFSEVDSKPSDDVAQSRIATGLVFTSGPSPPLFPSSNSDPLRSHDGQAILKCKRDDSMDNRGEWLVQKGQWKLRLEASDGESGTGRMEIVLVAVKLHVVSGQRARNLSRGFLG
ncbi:hypothetical protein PAAG_08801 [Paracoccidioides lutzii Pb01]|uniref:Uncharacterized protein n=1 Tax=Paracoccidioides lutzii (strain ATCC MYA-826 / Pb01) TaxID=502779 RepID=C1HDG0_PARBA|nr:hypothetical protein PAAG_08801 [Paracoccidioides lutzii Pb01]EEH39531.2 hypothetical protein PAAG_08801 [Paracoccidioides lutzii Pb01]